MNVMKIRNYPFVCRFTIKTNSIIIGSIYSYYKLRGCQTGNGAGDITLQAVLVTKNIKKINRRLVIL